MIANQLLWVSNVQETTYWSFARFFIPSITCGVTFSFKYILTGAPPGRTIGIPLDRFWLKLVFIFFD